MISRTVRTLTAVSALVLGFGPAVVQAADANNTPYAKYVDCGSSQLRTSCVERGEVMNFAQLRDIITAAMYRDAMERRRTLRPDSDYTDSSADDDSTTIRPGDRPAYGNPETSTTDNSTPIRLRPPQSADETAEERVAVAPVLIPPSLPVVVRYERGIDDQNTESSRLVFTVKDETGESSSYSVNVSDETGQYIEREIIRTPEPTTRTSQPTTRTPEPIIRTSETPPTTAETEVAAATPLDMQEIFVSQEMIPVSSNTETFTTVVAAPATVTPSSPSQPTAAPLPSQTTVQAEIQSVPAPAPSGSPVIYLPPAQIVSAQIAIMQSSIDAQPVTASSYTYSADQQPATATATSYVFRVRETAQTVTASPVITLRLRSEQATDDQTTSTITLTSRSVNEGAATIQPYVIMISSTETVHVVPQQVETAPVNVLTAFRDTSIGVTPGENVRDQSYSGTNETSPSEPGSSAPSNDGGDDDGGDDDDGGNQGGPIQ